MQGGCHTAGWPYPECDSLHQGVCEDKGQGRGSQGNAVALELHQNAQPEKQLNTQETCIKLGNFYSGWLVIECLMQDRASLHCPLLPSCPSQRYFGKKHPGWKAQSLPMRSEEQSFHQQTQHLPWQSYMWKPVSSWRIVVISGSLKVESNREALNSRGGKKAIRTGHRSHQVLVLV